MSSTKNVFLEIPCLTEKTRAIQGILLSKKWFKAADRRYIAESLQKFISYNLDNFKFIEVSPLIEGSDRDVSICFRSGKYVGVIPLRAPDTGKQIGDFVVIPRYTSSKDHFSDFIEILTLIQKQISPEFKHSIPLASGENIKPPLYLESVKYVNLLVKALRLKWNKFQNTQRKYHYPKAQIAWAEYIKTEYDPAQKIVYPCYDNILTIHHDEFYQLKYVFNIAVSEIKSPRTPNNIKIQIQDTLNYLENSLKNMDESPTSKMQIHNSDPLIIKQVKMQGNKILTKNSDETTAWRIDFSALFEKYVQYVFKQVSLEIGAIQLDNYKIRNTSKNIPSWSLSYLEPDSMLVKSGLNIIIDAKYKSHILNISSKSDLLKEEHRKDLHQLLAYCSFDKNENKVGFLCYPSNEVFIRELDYFSSISGVKNKVFLVGIPMKKSKLVEITNTIIENINDIEKLLFDN